MSIFGIIILSLAVAKASNNEFNQTAYDELPPLYHLDDFDACLDDDYGLYCVMDINLSAKNNSSLMNYIIEYSSNSRKHYRRDHLHQGICVTRTCKDFFDADQLEQLETNESLVLDVLDKCMNYGLEKQYGLQGKLLVEYCNHKNQPRKIDGYDIAVGAVLIALLLTNVFSTCYDIYVRRIRKKKANKWMASFSLLANWKKLTALPGDSQNGDQHVGGLEGAKFLVMICVIFSHMIFAIVANYIQNPEFTESSLNNPMHQFVYNGTLVIQIYFCIASFLLSYKFASYMQRNAFNFFVYPMGLFQRWLRLTPVYAVMIAFVATWVPHLGRGPLWDHVVTAERNACRQNWWTHILYINNYMPNNMFCLYQSWYLGADTQLFCFGLAVMMFIWKFPKSAKFVFPLMVLATILISAVHTYLGGYEAMIMSTPENMRVWYSIEPTFKDVYIAGHTNSAAAAIGLWAGYILFYIRSNDIKLKNNKWLRYGVYILIPINVGLILSGYFFYRPAHVYSRLGAAAYAGLARALFSTIVVATIISMNIGLAGVYRKLFYWNPLQIPGKLTYCALFIHPILQRALVGIFRKPFYMTDYYLLLLVLASITCTYLLAVPLTLLVELPASNLQKLIFFRRKNTKNQTVQNIEIANNMSLASTKERTQL